jgi:uncharacterized protein (DUF885 family)
MKKSLVAGLCLLVITACGGSSGNGGGQEPPPQGPTAAEQFEEALQGLTLDEYYETSIAALVQRSPEGLIWRSLHEVYPQTDARLDNLSDAYQRETFELAQIALDALRTYDRSLLDADGQLNYDLYEWYLQDIVDRLPFMYHDFPATYGIFGVPRSTEQLFTEVHPMDSLEDAEDYVARLALIEAKFQQLEDHLDLQEERGIVEPALTMQVAINQLAPIAGTDGINNPYYRALADKTDGHPDITDAQRDALLNEAFSTFDSSIKRAYQSLLGKLQAQVSSAPMQIGVGQYLDGAAYYEYALKHHTTTDLTPAEIHQLGLDELVRIRAEMLDILVNELGYDPNLTLSQHFALVRQDGGVIPAANVKSTYEAIIEQANQDVSEAFDIFPTSDVVVIGVPFGGYYIGPSADGSRPGAFYAGTQNDESWFPMRSLAYHEAIPGHHTQIAIALDQDQPVYRAVQRSTGFIEGWALYAERLAWELGWHDNDPYSNLGRLQYEALRASRLVMDTGIHSLGWTFEQAVQFNIDNIGATLGSSQGAAARYSVWPGQATAYMVGMLQILDERQRAMDALGPQFDLKAFHRALLTNGSVPLAFLDDIVDRYIAEAQAAN